MSSLKKRCKICQQILTRAKHYCSEIKVKNENKNRATVPVTNVESNIGDAALPADCFAEMASPVSIRVISYRKLNHDPDGISAKAVIDGIVQAGILADDSTKQVKEVTFESRKSKDERTIIEISDE